ncbi:MAG: type II secretion system protein [Elusimicrobia bacterium]|nr:type II secretion system protein [Elusimicrobiota bacterium]
MSARPARGFTLIELLVVVMIIGILAAVGFTQYTRVVESAKAEEALALAQSIANAVRSHRLDYGSANVPAGLMNGCDPTLTTGSSATDPCNLMYLGYMAKQNLATRPWDFYAGDCSGNSASTGMTACAKRKTGAPTPYSSWSYEIDAYGQVTPKGDGLLPPAP